MEKEHEEMAEDSGVGPEVENFVEEETTVDGSSTKKARQNVCEEEMEEEEEHVEELLTNLSIVPRAANLPGVRTTQDTLTGESRTYVVPGAAVYEDIISRFDKARGRPKEGSEAEQREREKMVSHLMEQYHIRVPATPEDMENPHLEVENHEVEPGGPKIPTIWSVPNPHNPLHVELLWRQKGQRIYDQTIDSTTGRPGVVSVKEAMTNGERIPYCISRVELVKKYNIKSPMKLAISQEALNQAAEFYAANIQEQLRESSLLPTPVPTPWLLFVYDASPKGVAQNNYILISKYMMIYHALEAKIKHISKASRATKELCHLAAYGKLEEYENEAPAYATWKKPDVLRYIKEWQEVRSDGKKAKDRVNMKHGMTVKNVFCWAFFTRTIQSNVITRAYYSDVVQLVRIHANELDLEEVGRDEGDTPSTQVDQYKESVEKVSTNPKFLKNLYKLHCEYMFEYIRNLEEFLLLLSFQHIPVEFWDHLVIPPLVDPVYPRRTYSDDAHTAIASAVSVLEEKTLMGTIKEIRGLTEQIQIQHLVRMGHATLENPPVIEDDSARIYGDNALSVPTFFQMKMYCKWLCFVTEEVDHKLERKERDALLEQNIQKRIEHAHSIGRNVILHTREGETVQSFPKATGKRRDEK